MQIQQQRFTCHRCGEVFEAETVINAPVAVVIASWKVVSCPKCNAGANEVGFGGEKTYVPGPPVMLGTAARADWWWENGERGVSSETIFCACSGRSLHQADYPYDPADFRRCHRLLEIVPEWRLELERVTRRWPWFGPFERRWPEFERLWEEERKNSDGKAPRLYEALKEARVEADAIRNGCGPLIGPF